MSGGGEGADEGGGGLGGWVEFWILSVQGERGLSKLNKCEQEGRGIQILDIL